MSSDDMPDPIMPSRPPLAALRARAETLGNSQRGEQGEAPERAREQIRVYRSWTAVELYAAIRSTLHEPHESPPSPGCGIG
jgi:hypothetical protein